MESQSKDEIENITSDWKKNVGCLLFHSLFATKELQELYDSCVNAATTKNMGVRVQLNIENPEAANYPWELICKDGTHISTDDGFSMARLVPGATGAKKEIKNL